MAGNTKSFTVARRIVAARRHSRLMVSMPVASSQCFGASPNVTADLASAFTFASRPLPNLVEYRLWECHRQTFPCKIVGFSRKVSFKVATCVSADERSRRHKFCHGDRIAH